MKNSWYSFEVPIGWVLAALLISAVLAFVLYSKKDVPWKQNANILLGALRLSSIFLILLLLLNPLFKLSVNDTHKPIVILAIGTK